MIFPDYLVHSQNSVSALCWTISKMALTATLALTLSPTLPCLAVTLTLTFTLTQTVPYLALT